MEQTILTESSLLQLRQMALENTERIDMNEQAIETMNTRLDKEEREHRDFYARLNASLETHEREMQALHRFLHESSAKFNADLRRSRAEFEADRKRSREEFEADLKKSREEFEERLRKSEEDRKRSHEEFEERQRKFEERQRKFEEERKRSHEEFEERQRKFEERLRKSEEERKRSHEEFEERMRGHDKRFETLQASIDKANEAITRTSVEFLGVTGHIVEGLASSAVYKVFKEAGLDVVNYGKNIRPRKPDAHDQMEIDVMLVNDRFSIPVEVKANFTRQKMRHFIAKMQDFRRLFPEFADREVVAAVAALNYERGSDRFAQEEGLLVIHVNSNNLFSLAPFKEEDLHRF